VKHKRPPAAVIVAVLLLVIGGAAWFWWQQSRQPAVASTALPGTVETREYAVAPALAGRITGVTVAEGATVTKGQKLVTIDAAALKLQLSQARQGVKAAKAAVTNARDDGTKADVTAAKARLAQAEAAVKLAGVQLGYATVTAPRAGVVVSVVANVGQNAAPGKTLLTLTDPADSFVRVFVPETRIGAVTMGQKARITTDSSADGFDGTVTFIAGQAEFTPNNVETKDQRAKLVYEVRLRVGDTGGTLKPGMPVDVALS
jgi:HlyD family secretion protein